MVVHDFAYADLVFDGYTPPSFLQIPGAKEIGVEFFSLSKSYSMPGWRVGFCAGQSSRLIAALRRIKSYLDYGMFQPIQIAAIIALNGPDECVKEVVEIYRQTTGRLGGRPESSWLVHRKAQRDHVCVGKDPGALSENGVSRIRQDAHGESQRWLFPPAVGFGEYGDDHVRFALVENPHRINQAIRGIKQML